MQGDFTISGEGRLVEDPELRWLPSGQAMCKFTIVTQPRKRSNSGEWSDGEPSFWNCTTWGKTAELVAESLQKGNLVIAEGTIGQRRYESNTGEKRVAYEINVERIGPSLKWDAAKVLRTERASAGKAPVGGSSEDPWATTAPARTTEPIPY